MHTKLYADEIGAILALLGGFAGRAAAGCLYSFVVSSLSEQQVGKVNALAFVLTNLA